jgi:hypothetical protein
MPAIARGQITITNLNDAKSLNVYLGSNQPMTQIFNKENSSYVPNWGAAPHLVITPELYVSGTTENVAKHLKATPTYKINGSSDLAAFGATVGTATPYALTIKNNMGSRTQLKIEFSGVYREPDTGLESPVKAVATYTKAENTAQLIHAIAYAPKGNIFKNGQQERLTAHCDLWRGGSIETRSLAYQWYKMKSDGTWEKLDAQKSYGITGYTTNEINIPASAVLNIEAFKCDIKDNLAGSGTKDKTVSAFINFTDLSDPYVIDITSSTGDKLVNGQGSTTLSPKVWQDGQVFADTAVDAKFDFSWQRFDKDGKLDTQWGGKDISTKKGRTQTVTSNDVKVKSTFVVELSLK